MRILYGKDYELIPKNKIPQELQKQIEEINQNDENKDKPVIVVDFSKPYFNRVFNFVNQLNEELRVERKNREKGER